MTSVTASTRTLCVCSSRELGSATPATIEQVLDVAQRAPATSWGPERAAAQPSSVAPVADLANPTLNPPFHQRLLSAQPEPIWPRSSCPVALCCSSPSSRGSLPSRYPFYHSTARSPASFAFLLFVFWNAPSRRGAPPPQKTCHSAGPLRGNRWWIRDGAPVALVDRRVADKQIQRPEQRMIGRVEGSTGARGE